MIARTTVEDEDKGFTCLGIKETRVSMANIMDNCSELYLLWLNIPV